VKRFAVFLVVSIVAAGCSGGGSGKGGTQAASLGPPVTAGRDASREQKPAITVGSTVISFAQAEDELDNIGHNQAYIAYIEPKLAAGGGSVLVGDAFDASFARMTLTRLVQFTLVHDGVAAQGMTLSDDCRTLAAQVLPAELTGGADLVTGKALLAGFTPGYQAVLLQRRTELAALMAALAKVPCAQTVPATAAAPTASPTPDQQADAATRLRAQQAYQDWYQDQLTNVPISVDPSIGTFVAAAGQILPPGTIDSSGPGGTAPTTSTPAGKAPATAGAPPGSTAPTSPPPGVSS
jgi:hypothetical protein